jgi:hypothetical protein
MRKRKMQKIKNKTKTIMISILLIISMSASIMLMPNTNAHTPVWTISSYAYLTTAPNPVGVGQTMAIVMWIDAPMPSAALGNDIRRRDYTLTITKPDGKVETQHWDVIFDPTNVQYYRYTPDQVGTYTLKFDYPNQTYTWSGSYQNDVFIGASKTTTFTVQEEPIPNPRDSYPLPTEYWTYPIEGQNTYWYTISSNWLGEPYITSGVAQGGGTSGNYFGRIQTDGLAPNSAHIMWTKPIQYGGIAPGNSTGIPGEMFYTGSSYNPRFNNALIMYGKLYYQEPYGNSGSGGDYVAVDLRTGQEQWRANTTSAGVPSFGYLFAYDDPNQHGILPNGLLFTNNFARAYDPSTGIVTTMNVTDVPSADTLLAAVAGPNGEILRIDVINIGSTANPNWRLLQWNSSKVVGYLSGTGVGGWYSGTINASLSSRYDYNVSITLPNSGSWRVDRASFDNIMLLVQGTFGVHTDVSSGANVTAVSLKPETRGQVLWTKYFPPTEGNVTCALSNWDTETGVFILSHRETNVMYGYSLSNGNLLWGPTEPTNDYTYFRQLPSIAYGNIYYSGYGGILYCYDDATGKLLWTYGNGGAGNSTYAGFDTPYGTYPIFVDVIADGKVYLATTEHSPNSPFYKDAVYRCINATDGTEIWTLMGWGTGMDAAGYDRAADGFFVFLNCYDMQIYCIGKGPSAMTLEAPMAAITQGSSLVIRGTVTDISAGTKQAEQAARFPNGVPAVSDASQTGWMEYVYMQKPRPMDTVGVPIVLSVVDANGNYRDIGTTTSNNGFFSFNWKPDIEGQYTVYASFAGSESYWPSNAVTSFVVDPSAATPTPTEAPIQSAADMYFVPAIAGLFVFVAIIGVVLALLMLRKRP